jgi:hypothetical protein
MFKAGLTTILGALVLQTGALAQIHVKNPGNVGIGNTTPTTKLDISGQNVFQQRIASSGTFAGLYMKSGTATRQLGLHFGSDGCCGVGSNTLRFGRYDLNGNELGNGWQANVVIFDLDGPDASLLVDESGNVGIGVFNPGYKLHVNGQVRASSFVADGNTWADFVFDSSYQLPSLAEVKNYINQHHHLPEVPSAEKVKKDGVNLNDNQVLLLKKIEELTLYVIEQNEKQQLFEKELKAIREENAALKTEVKELKNKRVRK